MRASFGERVSPWPRPWRVRATHSSMLANEQCMIRSSSRQSALPNWWSRSHYRQQIRRKMLPRSRVQRTVVPSNSYRISSRYSFAGTGRIFQIWNKNSFCDNHRTIISTKVRYMKPSSKGRRYNLRTIVQSPHYLGKPILEARVWTSNIRIQW